jgi:hypothetical protein
MDDHNQNQATITKSKTPQKLWIGGLLGSIYELFKQIIFTVLLCAGRKKNILWFYQFLINNQWVA